MKKLVFRSLMLAVLLFSLTAQESAEKKVKVAVIPIHGEIDNSLTVFLRRSIKIAKDEKVGVIIFDINTFGGRVDSALEITTLIGSANNQAVTVAYVPATTEGTGVSWSAGALISFSCQKIFMAPGTSIGAAAPVYETGQGMEMAPEKVVSAVRAQFAALAEKNGYPMGIALAMVDKDVQLHEVTINGKLSVATAEELPGLQKEAKKNHQLLEEGKLISKTGKLLTLTAGEMKKYGVSSGTVNSYQALLEVMNIPAYTLVELKRDIPDQIVAFLTSAAVTGLLITVGLIALYLEITSPGFGIPGTLALLCFSVVFFGSFMLDLVNSFELILFLIGVALLLAELFLIPGFGITGASGIVLIIVALILSRQDFIWPQFEWEWSEFRVNFTTVALSLVGSAVAISIIITLFPRSPLFNRLILKTSNEYEIKPNITTVITTEKLIGQRGVVVTPLRPVGKARFAERIVTVEAEGEFLEKGTEVEVKKINGNMTIVRRV